MINCNECGYDNPPQAKSCEICGYKLVDTVVSPELNIPIVPNEYRDDYRPISNVSKELKTMITCNECRHDNPPGTEYCEVCGYELAGASAVDPHATLLQLNNPVAPNEIDFSSPSPLPDSDRSSNLNPPATLPTPAAYNSPSLNAPPLSPTPDLYNPPNLNAPPPVNNDPNLNALAPNLTSALFANTARLIAKTSGATAEFKIVDQLVIIGKFDPETGPVDIDLEEFPGEETISRNHAEIYYEHGEWKVRDLGSTNGVFIKPLNQSRFGARITQPANLNAGDEIAFAKIRFIFQSP
jgi:ribosomal protein L40E